MIRRPWPSGRKARTTAASAAVVLLLTTVCSPAAWASNRGQVSGAESFTGTGTWGAAPNPTSVSWATGSNLHQPVTVNDTGTIALKAMTYKVVVSNSLLGGGTYTLAACTVPWANNLCNGGPGAAIGTAYGVGSTTTVTSTVVPPLNGSIYLQATASTTGVFQITMTLTVSVSATQTRTPITTQQ